MKNNKVIDSIKVLEWNVKGAATLNWFKKSPYEITKNLVDEVIKQCADIIVLVEFCVAKGWDYLEEQLCENDYVFFMSSLTGKNGILICIKSNLINKAKMKNNVYQDFSQVVSYNFDDCNFLRVSFEMEDGRNATIIGCRIEVNVNSELTEKEYNQRRLAFEKFIKDMFSGEIGKNSLAIETSDICIVAGDFNNAQCYGNLKKRYNKKDYFNRNTKKYRVQINYNLNIIKDRFEDLGFKMADIGEEQKRNDITTYGKKTTLDKKKADYDYPDDHIFVRGLNSQKTSCDITPIPANLSDHAILWAEFDLS